MKIRIRAYKSNDLKNGETIALEFEKSLIVCCCAEDIEDIISKLTEAKDYALNASTEDEEMEWHLHL